MVAPLTGFPGLTGGGSAGQPFISPHLRVVGQFYPHQHALSGTLGGLDRSDRVVATPLDTPDRSAPSLTEMTWHKVLGQPSGRWSLTVKPGRDKGSGLLHGIDELDLVDGDWCDLFVIRNGVKIPVCRGPVDAVRERREGIGGVTQVSWVIEGRDHGALFEYPITYSNLWVQTLTELVGGLYTARVKGKVGGSPDQMFRVLIEAAFSAKDLVAGQWTLPTSFSPGGVATRFFDVLKIVTFGHGRLKEHLRGAYYNELQLWTQAQQTLWQTLTQWCNPLLNEIYCDLLMPSSLLPQHGLAWWVPPISRKVIVDGQVVTTPGEAADQLLGSAQMAEASDDIDLQMAAFIRERPFPNTVTDDSLWNDLPTWRVPTWLLRSSELGRSGEARYNLFSLLADLGTAHSEQQAAAPPIWSKEDIQRRGLRSYEQTTRFYGDPDQKVGFSEWMTSQRSTWQTLLRDWFAPAPLLLTGQVVAKTLLPEVRIGQKLVLDDGSPADRQVQAYVEGTMLRYQAPTGSSGASGETSFVLTHGFRGDDAAHQKLVQAVANQFEETL